MRVHARKDDIVVVVLGKDKEKTGKVLKVGPRTGKVIVQGVNMVKKHQEPARTNTQGGIIEREGAIYSSKVALCCAKCKDTARTSNKILESGTKVRARKEYGEAF